MSRPPTWRTIPRVPGNQRKRAYDERKRAYDKTRPSASQRGYGAEWRRLRETVLVRSPLCVKCSRPATEVDHITPRKAGGTDDPDNLQPMCKPCHSRKTAREDGRWSPTIPPRG